jgi:hypothetical protein
MLDVFPVLQHVLPIDLNNAPPMEVEGDEADEQNHDNANLLDLNSPDPALDQNMGAQQ